MIVSLAAYNRPQYLAEVLDALDTAITTLMSERGEATFVLASVDPSPQVTEIETVLNAGDRRKWTWMLVNEEQKGCSGNTLLAVDRAFNLAQRFDEPYVQHLEDDFVFAADSLLLSAWLRDTYLHDRSVLCTGISTAHAATPDEYWAVHKSDWFHCQGWGTWRDRWEAVLKPSWQTPMGAVAKGGWAQNFNDNAFHYLPASWDTQLGGDLFGKGKGDDSAIVPSVNGKLYQVIPRLSRVKHIGLEGGVHTTPATFERDLPKVFADDVTNVMELENYYALPGALPHNDTNPAA